MPTDSHSSSNDAGDRPSSATDPAADVLVAEVVGPRFGRGRLSARQAETFVQRVAELSQAGLPLPGGLRAAAAETHSRRLRGAFLSLASTIDAGPPLEDALAAQQGSFPGHVRGLVIAAVQSGKLPEVLTELIDHHRRLADLWRAVLAAAAYPVILLVLTVVIFSLVNGLAVAPLAELFTSFDIEMPHNTAVLIWLGSVRISTLVWIVAGGKLAEFVLRLALGAARWRRLVYRIPLIGPIWRWSGASEWARIMSILVRHEVALPDALHLAATAVRDANLGQASLVLSQRVERGQSLEHAIASGVDLPASAIPFLAWGERQGSLSEAFETIAEGFEMRARLRANLLRRVVPPLIFLLVGVAVLTMLSALFAPMLQLLNSFT